MYIWECEIKDIDGKLLDTVKCNDYKVKENCVQLFDVKGIEKYAFGTLNVIWSIHRRYIEK